MANKGSFKPGEKRPGQSPGRPAGLKNRSTILKEAIAADNSSYYAEKAKSDGRVIIDNFFDAAKRGRPWAIQEFFNREFGRVTEKIEHSGDIKLTARFDFEGTNG